MQHRRWFGHRPLTSPTPHLSSFTSSISIDVGISFAALGGITGRQLHHSSNFLSLPHLFSQLVRTNGNKAYVIDTLALVRRLEAQQVPSKQAEAITSVITIVWRMLPSPRLEAEDAEELRGVDEVRPSRVGLESYEERCCSGEKLDEGRPHKWMTRNCACTDRPRCSGWQLAVPPQGSTSPSASDGLGRHLNRRNGRGEMKGGSNNKESGDEGGGGRGRKGWAAPIGEGGTSQGVMSKRQCCVGDVGWRGSVMTNR
ncbi:hypothetical protein C4D60_Mb03t11680 [Musa balbisiana]|uniref:Uncharacterized protein n=1 Tax=Musa balbisiana TaxID=52838 RepID=A0A4S8J973_MUSBA|nr:hypothetical protein C4D60_Mb03t11680 [Musa balbisiana]